MGPGLYQPPSSTQMVLAVVGFTAVTTMISMLMWIGIRRTRQRPRRPMVWFTTAGVSALISGLDVSLATVTQGGSSGIFSIFSWIVIPAYAAIVIAGVVVAAIWMD